MHGSALVPGKRAFLRGCVLYPVQRAEICTPQHLCHVLLRHTVLLLHKDPSEPDPCTQTPCLRCRLSPSVRSGVLVPLLQRLWRFPHQGRLALHPAGFPAVVPVVRRVRLRILCLLAVHVCRCQLRCRFLCAGCLLQCLSTNYSNKL